MKKYFLLIFLLFPAAVKADVQVVNFPGSVVNEADGFLDWTNPSNAIIEDGIVSSATINSLQTNNLKSTSYGFTIPNGALILGIMLEVKKTASAGNFVKDAVVKLYGSGGTLVGNDKSIVGDWPSLGTPTWTSYGGFGDLWGTIWKSSDINSSNFGAAFAADRSSAGPQIANVDSMRITVYFRPTTIYNGTIYNGTLR